MPLVNMRDMLYHAYENNYAVGAFDLVSLDFRAWSDEELAAQLGRHPSDGASEEANKQLVYSNVRLAAHTAMELAKTT